MKNKIVLWGTDEKNEDILIALELMAEVNKVKIYTFPGSSLKEDDFKGMMDEWRNDKPFELPSDHTVVERDLKMVDNLLPDEIKVKRTDVIRRAQTEWNFIVLSTKLHKSFQSEIAELKEKVDQLSSYDKELWDALKTFWNKVQRNMQDKTILREHYNELRQATNDSFDKLKGLRKTLNEEYTVNSAKLKDEFLATLGDIETKVNEGLRLQPLFNQLKNLQRKFHDTNFTREDRNSVWASLDKMFKIVKEKRFGADSSRELASTRTARRLKGLEVAIDKMVTSITRDKEDLQFQNRRANTSEGQLEAQIRQAKIQMIQEKITSKEEKLNDMNQTKKMLEQRIEKEKKNEEKDKQRTEAAKVAKEKIAQKVEESKEVLSSNEEQLKKAAELLKSEKEAKQEDSLLGAATSTIGEALGDALDTVKAVGKVVADKVSESVAEVVEEVKEDIEDIKENLAEAQEAAKEKIADIKEEITEEIAEAKEEIAEVKAEISEEIAEVKEDIAEAKKEINEDEKDA